MWAVQPSGLGWMPDGSLLVVSRRDRQLLRRSAQGVVSVHADLSGLSSGFLNDMVVDHRGRAYVGEFGFDLDGQADPDTAVLIRIDPDGSAAVAAEDLCFRNGSVITPDGGTHRRREHRLAVHSLRHRRGWLARPSSGVGAVSPTPEFAGLSAMLARLRFAPDGCALDPEGHLWAADGAGGRCVRLTQGAGSSPRWRCRTASVCSPACSVGTRVGLCWCVRRRTSTRRPGLQHTRRFCSPPRSTFARRPGVITYGLLGPAATCRPGCAVNLGSPQQRRVVGPGRPPGESWAR